MSDALSGDLCKCEKCERVFNCLRGMRCPWCDHLPANTRDRLGDPLPDKGGSE